MNSVWQFEGGNGIATKKQTNKTACVCLRLCLLLLFFVCCSCSLFVVFVLCLLFLFFVCCSCSLFVALVLLFVVLVLCLLFLFFVCCSCSLFAVFVLCSFCLVVCSVPQTAGRNTTSTMGKNTCEDCQKDLLYWAILGCYSIVFLSSLSFCGVGGTWWHGPSTC